MEDIKKSRNPKKDSFEFGSLIINNPKLQSKNYLIVELGINLGLEDYLSDSKSNGIITEGLLFGKRVSFARIMPGPIQAELLGSMVSLLGIKKVTTFGAAGSVDKKIGKIYSIRESCLVDNKLDLQSYKLAKNTTEPNILSVPTLLHSNDYLNLMQNNNISLIDTELGYFVKECYKDTSIASFFVITDLLKSKNKIGLNPKNLKAQSYLKDFRIFQHEKLKSIITKQRFLQIEPILDCNNSCTFCAAASERMAKRRKIGINKIINKLNKIEIGSDDIVNITGGGEPTLYNDLFSLIKYIKSKGAYLILTTNCRLLSRVDYAKRLVTSGVNEFEVSFHTTDGDSFDGITRSQDSFQETLSGLKNLSILPDNSKHLIAIKLIVGPHNHREAEKIIPFLIKEKISIGRVIVSPLYSQKYDKRYTVNKEREIFNGIARLCRKKQIHLDLISFPLCNLETDNLYYYLTKKQPITTPDFYLISPNDFKAQSTNYGYGFCQCKLSSKCKLGRYCPELRLLQQKEYKLMPLLSQKRIIRGT